MIVFDENVDKTLIDEIKRHGYEIISILEYDPGISVEKWSKLLKLNNGILITEDKDFGELVFSYNLKDCSVIFFCYDKSDSLQIAKNIISVLTRHLKPSTRQFITITKRKIRIRKI